MRLKVDTLEKMNSANNDLVIRICDRALLLFMNDMLFIRNKLVPLLVKDFKNHIKNGIESSAILLWKVKPIKNPPVNLCT